MYFAGNKITNFIKIDIMKYFVTENGVEKYSNMSKSEAIDRARFLLISGGNIGIGRCRFKVSENRFVYILLPAQLYFD